MRSTSRSIPISPDKESMKRARAEASIHRDEIMADFADFVFCSRLVHGIQKKQSFTHDVSLRYENQALIDHIIATRRDATSKSSFHSSRPALYDEMHARTRPGTRTPPRCESDEHMTFLPSDFAGLVESLNSDRIDGQLAAETEDMIFELEL
jgi:hypothetical protein